MLLNNSKLKISDFQPDQEIVKKFIQEVEPLRVDSNTAALSIVEFPEEEQIRKHRIQEIVTMLENIGRYLI